MVRQTARWIWTKIDAELPLDVLYRKLLECVSRIDDVDETLRNRLTASSSTSDFSTFRKPTIHNRIPTKVTISWTHPRLQTPSDTCSIVHDSSTRSFNISQLHPQPIHQLLTSPPRILVYINIPICSIRFYFICIHEQYIVLFLFDNISSGDIDEWTT